MRTWALAIGLLLASAACSRSSLRIPSGGASTGVGGAPSTTTSSSSTDVSTSASSGTGLPVCGVETHDTVQIGLQVFQGPLVGCSAGGPPGGGTMTHSVTGVVISASNGTFTIDSCPPNSDCAGQFSTLTLGLSGFIPSLPVGAFVEVRVLEVANAFSCSDTLMVRNLPTWDGVANPVSSGDVMWLAASNSVNAFADAPYQIEAVPLGCFPDPGGGCGAGPMDDYFFRVTVGDSSFDVGMGISAEVGSPPQWVFHNLQSHQTGLCDDPGSFDYWMGIPMLD